MYIYLVFLLLPNILIVKNPTYFFIIPEYYNIPGKIKFLFNYAELCLTNFELEEKRDIINILNKIDFSNLISKDTTIKQIQIFIEMFICNFKEENLIDNKLQFLELRNQAEILNLILGPLELNEKYISPTHHRKFSSHGFFQFILIIFGLTIFSYSLTLSVQYFSYIIFLKIFKQSINMYDLTLLEYLLFYNEGLPLPIAKIPYNGTTIWLIPLG